MSRTPRTPRRRPRKPAAPNAGSPSDHAHREAAALERTDHCLSLDEWAERLARLTPEEHAAPPPPRRASLALSRKARVALYTNRAAAGESLWSKDDLIARNEAAAAARSDLPASMVR